MNARPLIHASAFLLLFASACHGDALSVGGGEPLEPENVNDISPGDALGNGVTGAYLFTGFETRACSCRSGSEATVCGESLSSTSAKRWMTASRAAFRSFPSMGSPPSTFRTPARGPRPPRFDSGLFGLRTPRDTAPGPSLEGGRLEFEELLFGSAAWRSRVASAVPRTVARTAGQADALRKLSGL